MVYKILELQTAADGSVAHIVSTKDTLPDALEKYYQMMAYACKTTLPTHGVMIITGEGEVVKAEFYHAEPAPVEE